MIDFSEIHNDAETDRNIAWDKKRFDAGFQAGLKRGAEIAENSTYWPLEGADIAKEILKEIDGEQS